MQPLISFNVLVEPNGSFTLPFNILNEYTISVSDEKNKPIKSNKIYIEDEKVFLKDFYLDREYPCKVTVRFITKDFWC